MVLCNCVGRRRVQYSELTATPDTDTAQRSKHFKHEIQHIMACDGGIRYQRRDANFCTLNRWIDMVHIPKTAGSSLRSDLQRALLASSIDVVDSEKCILDRYERSETSQLTTHRHQHVQPAALRVAMFRSPRAHVLSEYLECRYDTSWTNRYKSNSGFPDNGTLEDGFLRWLGHFASEPNRMFDYGCCEYTIANHH